MKRPDLFTVDLRLRLCNSFLRQSGFSPSLADLFRRALSLVAVGFSSSFPLSLLLFLFCRVMSSPWAVFQAHAKHFGALYRGGAVAREEVQAKRSDGDFLRRANLVDSALQQAETAIEQYEMRSGEHLRLDDWEGDLEVRVEPIQLMLGELRRGLPRTRVASQDHMNFYEGIVKSLEQRTNALNIRLSVQRVHSGRVMHSAVHSGRVRLDSSGAPKPVRAGSGERLFLLESMRTRRRTEYTEIYSPKVPSMGREFITNFRPILIKHNII